MFRCSVDPSSVNQEKISMKFAYGVRWHQRSAQAWSKLFTRWDISDLRSRTTIRIVIVRTIMRIFSNIPGDLKCPFPLPSGSAFGLSTPGPINPGLSSPGRQWDPEPRTCSSQMKESPRNPGATMEIRGSGMGYRNGKMGRGAEQAKAWEPAGVVPSPAGAAKERFWSNLVTHMKEGVVRSSLNTLPASTTACSVDHRAGASFSSLPKTEDSRPEHGATNSSFLPLVGLWCPPRALETSPTRPSPDTTLRRCVSRICPMLSYRVAFQSRSEHGRKVENSGWVETEEMGYFLDGYRQIGSRRTRTKRLLGRASA
jgi:hypothetical protein